VAKKQEAQLILILKDKLSKPFKKITNGLKNFAQGIKSTANSFKGFASKLKKFVSDRLVITAGDITNALRSIGTAIVGLVRDADQYRTVGRAFENLAASQGEDAKKMLANMKKLSEGTISELTLMKQANNALLLGLPVDRFGDMLRIARSASKATGESMQFMLQSIVTGMGRGSKLVLDNLGIVFKLEDAYKEYAATLGKTSAQLTEAEKKQAFINKALAVGVENAEKAGEQGISLSESWDKLKASSENLSNHMFSSLAPSLTKIFVGLSNIIEATDIYANRNSVAGKSVSELSKDLEQTLQVIELNKTAMGSLKAKSEEFKNIRMFTPGELEERVKLIEAQIEKEGALESKRLAGIVQKKEDARTEALAKQRENDELDLENKIIKQEEELALIGANDQQQLSVKIKGYDAELKTNISHKRRMELLQKKAATTEILINKVKDEQMIKQRDKTLGLFASLTSSSNKRLADIGKAAALVQIAIRTPEAVGNAYTFGSKGGPVLGAVFGGIAAAAMASQAAQVAGVQLAEGGVVPATSGGMQATIGEGGRDEAVIPLDDFDGGGIGGNVTINVFGGLLGDESSAKEFALEVDKQLFNLRKNNESVAFDSGVV